MHRHGHGRLTRSSGDAEKAIHDPRHPEHRQFVDWLPNGTFDSDEFDPAFAELVLRSVRV